MPEGMVGYDEDLYLWSQQQAAALREAARRGVNLPVDWENVAEEIESLGRSDRNDVLSRMRVIVEHLLKLEFGDRPEPRRGWKVTVVRERAVLERVLAESPSLRARSGEFLGEIAPEAVKVAERSLYAYGELDAAAAVKRMGARYTLDQVLGDWFPEEPGEP
jgi:Domain of unknown function DUF29